MGHVIAVTGITGHSGSFFLKELQTNGCSDTVRCLVREASDTSALDRAALSIEKIAGVLPDEDAVKSLVKGAHTVLHIAGIKFSIPIVQASIDAGVRRVILVHTTGIYSKHKIASEGYKEIEAKLREIDCKDTDITILRPTMIFGDLCDHNISKFIKMVDRMPLMPEIDYGKCKIQPVNARDLGRAYYQAVYAPSLPDLSYDVTGERPITMHEMCLQIGEYLHKRVHFISVPLGLGVFCARALKVVTFGKADFVERVLRMGEDRDYPHDRATEQFGYFPEPFAIGLKREVELYMKAK